MQSLWTILPPVLVVGFLVRAAIATALERKYAVYDIDVRSVLAADFASVLFTGLLILPAGDWIGYRVPNPVWRIYETVSSWPLAPRIVLYLVITDLGHYVVHRLMHVPAFWRFHKWHHAPTHMYWLSGYRESFIDRVLVSLPYVWAWPLVASSPWMGSVLLTFGALKNDWMHLNVSWRLRSLEWLFVTPRFHHIHHSDDPAHYTKNLGVLFSVWDRLFGTYEDPDRAPAKLSFGIREQVPLIRLISGL